jgi:hypothetical protein
MPRMSNSKHRRQTAGQGDDELDLYTVLTALGTGRHSDNQPISQEAQYALAASLLSAAAEEGWEFANVPRMKLYEAILSARTTFGSPMALVPAAVAVREVLLELGTDPAGPADLDGLIAANQATMVVPGLALLAVPPSGARSRSAARSVTVKLPGN